MASVRHGMDADQPGGRTWRLRGMFFGNSRYTIDNTEKAQANVRIAISILAMVYFLFGMWRGFIGYETGLFVWIAFLAVFIFSLIIRTWIHFWPGVYHARRALTILNDYGALAATMGVGAEFTAPLFAILLWVTVGYGMRYGSRYLAICTIVALICLFAIAFLSPFWRGHPFLIGTMILTALIVPAYAHFLLSDTQRARDAAVATDLAKSRFLAHASHDLRQPIHAISLFTACLRDEGLKPDQRQMVDNIDRSIVSVSRLFRSLLDISTLDSGKLQANMDTVAVGPLLQDIADQNAQAARWANVDLRVVSSGYHVHADPDLVRTMVQNILTNALKYAPGRPVLVGCRKRGRSLSIWVCDRGNGIPASELGRVFDEFHRVPIPGRDIEGIGLGLPIVRRLAKLMGVSVSIRSTEGQGTTVTLDGFEFTKSRLKPAPFERIPQGTLLDGLRILLIEDNKEVLLATSTLLRKWGCGVQAESEMPKSVVPCDFILADFDLNGPANGVECIEIVWEMLGGRVPAIIMTGHDEGHIYEQIGDRDIPILAKPLQPAELRNLLMAQRLKGVACK